MGLKTKPFDAAEYLDDPGSQADLLSDAFESGDPGYIAHALGVVARARGMTEIAREAGVTREALYKALSEEGDPRLSTLLGVTRALGVTLSAAPATAPKRRSSSRTRSPSRRTAA
jgi:probable addiction module antidote protein